MDAIAPAGAGPTRSGSPTTSGTAATAHRADGRESGHSRRRCGHRRRCARSNRLTLDPQWRGVASRRMLNHNCVELRRYYLQYAIECHPAWLSANPQPHHPFWRPLRRLQPVNRCGRTQCWDWAALPRSASDSCRSPTWGARPSPSTECGHSDSPVAVGEEVARMDGVVADWRSARRDGTRLRTVDKYPRNSTQLWFNIRREATPRHCGSSVSRLLRAQRRRWPQRRRLWPDSRPSARWAVAAVPLVVGLPLLVGPAPAGAMASMALRQTAPGWGAGLAGLRSTGPALAHTVLSRRPGDLDLPLPPATSAARSGVGADGAGPALLDPTRLCL